MNTVTAPYGAWLTIKQAADRLGVSVHHVNHLAGEGKLGKAKLGRHQNSEAVIDRATVDAYLALPGLHERRARRTTIRPELCELQVAKPASSGPARGTRYPLRPLWLLLDLEANRDLSSAEVATRVGSTRCEVTRARSHGLTEQMADRWAVRIGSHPALVWGDDWWIAYEEEQRLASMRRHPSAARGVHTVDTLPSVAVVPFGNEHEVVCERCGSLGIWEHERHARANVSLHDCPAVAVA